MENTAFDGIVFADSLRDCDVLHYDGRVIHILCRQGSMSFLLRDVLYNIVAGDYVILPAGVPVSEFCTGQDFEGIVMRLSESFVASIAIRSNYGVIGHLSLLQNPVMKLSEHDFQLCEKALLYLRERMADVSHLFREELLGSLLTAHILDLYDIHARNNPVQVVSERAAVLIRRFIGLLHEGECFRHRDLDFYASKLCITPHYLSELCRKVSGLPASYWIDRFTLREVVRLLGRKELSLSAIAEQMNFSSVSYLSRYVQKQLGMSPSEYRNRSRS